MHSSAATPQVRLNADDLHHLKWILGQLLALIAVWALFDLDMVAEPLLLGTLILIAATLVFPKIPGFLPSFFWKAATAVLVVFVVVDFTMHGIQFLKPMVRMVMLLCIFRAFQYRKSREDLQVVLLCLFALVVKGVMTVSLLFAFQMLLFTPIAMALLFLINLLETSNNHTLAREDWARFRWIKFIPRLIQGLDFRLLAFAALLFTCLVSVSSLVFVLMPRFRVEQALPFLQFETTGKIGFSDTIRFGEVNQLMSDDSTALRVRVPELNQVPGRPYWRMVVLDEYRNGAFTASNSLKRRAENPIEGTGLPESILPRAHRSRDDAWTFYLEGDTSRYLPLPGPFREIQFSIKSKFWSYPETHVLMLDQVPTRVFGYITTGMTPTDRFSAPTVDQATLARAEGPLYVRQQRDEFDEPRSPGVDYPLSTLVISLSENDRTYLESIVETLTGGESMDAVTFSEKAATWLAENYSYDTRHDAPWDGMRDPLILWMQHSRRGWCEHFTGAFIMLCRTAGFPARAVAGFAGASWNDYEGYLIVRNSHAHAWAEVYDGEGHWFRVDPTPATDGSTFGMDSAFAASLGIVTGWTAWVDSLRMAWYRRVVNFDQTDQLEMASELKSQSKAFYESIKNQVLSGLNALKTLLFSDWDREKIIRALLSLAAACFAFLGLRALWRWLRQAASRGGLWASIMGGDPIRKQAGRLLLRFRMPPGNSVHLSDWRLLRGQLQLIRYGPIEQRPSHRSIFRQARRLLRRLHKISK